MVLFIKTAVQLSPIFLLPFPTLCLLFARFAEASSSFVVFHPHPTIARDHAQDRESVKAAARGPRPWRAAPAGGTRSSPPRSTASSPAQVHPPRSTAATFFLFFSVPFCWCDDAVLVGLTTSDCRGRSILIEWFVGVWFARSCLLAQLLLFPSKCLITTFKDFDITSYLFLITAACFRIIILLLLPLNSCFCMLLLWWLVYRLELRESEGGGGVTLVPAEWDLRGAGELHKVPNHSTAYRQACEYVFLHSP
jgi:hypothetical protein